MQGCTLLRLIVLPLQNEVLFVLELQFQLLPLTLDQLVAQCALLLGVARAQPRPLPGADRAQLTEQLLEVTVLLLRCARGSG